MEPESHPDSPRRSRFGSGPPEVGVHVLSEHVFCPRAALIAQESGDDSGDEDLQLGPQLDWMGDYDEHRFAEALHSAYGDLKLWLTLMAPAALLVLIGWIGISPLFGLALTLPMIFLLAKCWETLQVIIHLIRERALLLSAIPATIDLNPQEIIPVNWWSLRKMGFDCFKPERLRDPSERLTGRPWRELIRGRTVRIPVVRKHRGERVWGPQHVVRVVAYCRLIETCEGGNAPFGILMFADSYDCLLIPNTDAHQVEFQQSLDAVREFLRICETGDFVPAAPQDNRCSGCHHGKPRRQKPGSETKLNDLILDAFVRPGNDGAIYHSTCGDRFENVPPHNDVERLQIKIDS
ncbi:MAG: hypothetical protein R3C18_02785 [Planctomycetaceae bacterium]